MSVPFLPCKKKNVCVCVSLADITSLNVALGFWEGTGKTWKRRVCFLPLGFCGFSLLTGSCRHFGYARREWRPHWSAFPEVEGKKQANTENARRRSCLFDAQRDCLRFWMCRFIDGESLGSASTKTNLLSGRTAGMLHAKKFQPIHTKNFFFKFQSFIVTL